MALLLSVSQFDSPLKAKNKSLGLSVRSLSFLMIAFVALSVMITASPAEARKRRGGGGYSPPYAAMVMDAKTGRILHAVNEDSLRHPASVTKVMTIYMLLEQIERGKFSLSTPLRVSSNAASQAPSKIGFDVGDTLTAEDAIKALVTKSANDVAVTVAENIAGSEENFAEQMTRKARSLGMSRTTFRNASGLPDAEQVTTARDLVTLGRAIQDHFPQYYHYFGTRVFNFAGSSYRNHNKLLGRVEGVDGIKTGYTRMSGFNLLTSARSDDRHVIGVVLGGKSGSARDRVMASLIEAQLPRAFAGSKTIAPVVARAGNERARPAVISATAPRNSDSAMDATNTMASSSTPSSLQSASIARLEPKSEVKQQEARQQEAKPQPTVAAANSIVALPVARSQSVADARSSAPQPPLDVKLESRSNSIQPRSATAQRNLNTTTAENGATPAPFRWVTGPQAVIKTAALSGPLPPLPTGQAPQTHSARIALAHSSNAETTASISPQPVIADTKKAKLENTTPDKQVRSPSRSNWLIQLGATDEENKALDIINRAKSQSQRALSQAQGFTEKVQKDGAILYRARFSGFNEPDEANAACKQLKRSGFSCFATRG